MPNNNTDIVIIGQGLAGSILAYQLISRGLSVKVIDNNHHQSSSVVAAGIINPITGHRLNLTEGFNDYYPQAKACYANIEADLGIDLWSEIEQHRLIKNAGQLDYYKKRREQDDYRAILKPLLKKSLDESAIKSTLGIAPITHTAIINTTSLLTGIKMWLTERDCFVTKNIDYSTIQTNNNEINVGGIKTRKIIFCEGHQAIHNPWLKELPFKLSKGEILTLQTPCPITRLFNWGNWLAPQRQHTKLGSSYDWNDLSLSPNDETKNKLLTSLKTHTNIAGDVINHEVGIRPTTVQRKPFIGSLSNFNNTYCFNGFGSKGCLLIPHYANLLCQNIIAQQPLPNEVTRWL